MPKGILLDIEGTTTPISFVYDVLFPYARRHAASYLKNSYLADLQQEHDREADAGNSPPPWNAGPEAYVFWLMDHDRKSTALKRIQGEIWLLGYKNRELQSEVFPDVPPALKRWHEAGIDTRIFSSGSTLAQQLLFSNTKYGDLTNFLNGYFDTTTGAKTNQESYRRIVSAFGLQAQDILFISDVTSELDAAKTAQMQTALCIRHGNHPQPKHAHSEIAGFDEIS